MAHAPEQQPWSDPALARKLDRLFETVHPAGRGPYSPEEVAKAISAGDPQGVSPAYLYMLGAVRDGDLRRLATRANGLSAKSLAGLVQMVDVLRDLEELPTD